MRRAVSLVSTRGWYDFLKIPINSLLEHTQVDKIYLLIEDDEFPYELPPQTEIVNLHKLNCWDVNSPNMTSQYTFACYWRSAYSLFVKEDKVLQLDTDLIVVDDIGHLWDVNMKDNYAMMCAEYHGVGADYFNAGVAMFNLKQMRQDGMDWKVIDYLNTTPSIFLDQTCYNNLMKGRILEMPTRYNEAFATGYTSNPAIVHYCGFKKWWNLPSETGAWEPSDFPTDRRFLIDKYR